jgi:signal peptidase II
MIYILIVLIIAGGEYLIKNLMELKLQKGETRDILGGRITLNKVYNKGALLNFLQEKKEIVKTFSGILIGLLLLLFTIMLPKKGNKLFKLGLALVLGGAISNVSDRFLRGYVVDYFSIKSDRLQWLSKIVFNLADIAIFIGSLFLLLSSFFSSIFKSGSDKSTK